MIEFAREWATPVGRVVACVGRLPAAGMLAAAVAVGLPGLAQAKGPDTGAAIGIGLGSFALGTAVGAAASPYANPYPGYYVPPPPAYYPPAPAYYPPAPSCWDPYYQRYYAC